MKKPFVAACLVSALLAGTASAADPLGPCNVSYTLDADFDRGVLFNVNHNAPNNNQLQLNQGSISTFPILWIANAGEDTVSKLDSNTGKEVGRYRTWFGPAGQPGHQSHLNSPWSGPAPSRTCVDASGNVYVANRHFDGRPALVMKILSTGGIDRNGNGTIETSSDLNNDGVISGAEILPMGDNNPNNGMINPAEIQDERIAWAVQVGPGGGLGRSLSIGTDGHIWLGLYSSRTYYKISSVDGTVLAGPINVTGHSPYGSLVDSSGRLWGASLGNTLLKLETTPPYTPTVYALSGMNNYGIAIGGGYVFLAEYSSGLGPFRRFDPNTATWFSANRGFTTLGISTASNGDVFVAGSTVSGSQRGASRLRPDGSIVWTAPIQGINSDQRGAVVDANGDVWVVLLNANRVAKYRGSDGAPLGTYPVGNSPYTYSDASGSSFLQQNPSGSWTIFHDRGANDETGCKVSWTVDVPAGTTFKVEVRADNTQAGLALRNFVEISNGSTVPGAVAGRYLEIRASMASSAINTTPVLYDLTVSACDETPPVSNCSYVTTAAHKIYTLTATDNCDAQPKIYIKDSASTFVAGPFANGDKVLVRTNPTQAPYQRTAPAPYKALVQLKGQGLVYAVDSDGNASTPEACVP